MKVVLVIERSSLVLWGAVIRDEGAKRSHTKWENIWKNTLKGKDLRVAVNLRTIEALMKKEVTHRKGDQKSRRNNIELEARKRKRKSIGDIHLRHHHQAHLMTILMRVNKEIMRARKAHIPNLGLFPRRSVQIQPTSRCGPIRHRQFWYLYERSRPNKSCPY